MINTCTFIGSVGQDPEIKTVGDNQVANFSIACNESWKDKNGENKEKTEWVRMTAWGKLAEIIEKWVKKGQLVYVEGKMETRSYDKDGQTHYQTSINLNTLKMLGGKKEGPNEGPNHGSTSAQESYGGASEPKQNTGAAAIPGKDGDKDDLPF